MHNNMNTRRPKQILHIICCCLLKTLKLIKYQLVYKVGNKSNVCFFYAAVASNIEKSLIIKTKQ